MAVLQGHRRRVSGCVSDARGKLIVSVGWDFSVKLWSGLTGESQGDLAIDRSDSLCGSQYILISLFWCHLSTVWVKKKILPPRACGF